MKRGLYRKVNKGMCMGCDHPAYAPSKNVNQKRACVKCRKNSTKGGDARCIPTETQR